MRMIGWCCLAAVLWAQNPERPLRAVTDPGVVTTRQAITPAGVQSVFQGRVYGVAFGATEDELWVLAAGQVYGLDWKRNRVLRRLALAGGPGLQGIAYDPVARRALVSAAIKGAGVQLLAAGEGGLEPVGGATQGVLAGSPAIAGRRAAVPVISHNKLAVLDLDSGKTVAALDTAIAPFAVALDGNSAWVSNWGGRRPLPGERTAPAGPDPVSIDARGVAANGAVTRIDLATGGVTATISAGLHPNGLALDAARGLLYVADNNSDTVTVIDTRQARLVRTIRIWPFREAAAGIAPTALVVSRDGRKLWVACGGINAVAQIDTGRGEIEGLIPTAWYPNHLALSPDGSHLAVATLLGAGSGWRGDPGKRYVHSYRGSVAVLPLPDEAQLAGYTLAVAANTRLTLGSGPAAAPRRVPAYSEIEHVVYIIKENRTYDQVFGDLEKGNGDPSLVMFGYDVTPNQHRLAEQFVLLDNFYATGGNSGDGHQWVTQANETAYPLWPGYAGRSYPFDGSDPIAYSSGGFIWDAALNMKKTVRVYGEFVPALRVPESERARLLEEWRSGADFTNRWTVASPIPPLEASLAKNFPSYTNSIPDVVRAQIFLKDLERWKQEGRMPNLVMMLLNCDHTLGTRPGVSTPRAMVADNDLALGQIVEALTESPFWKKMAIFVVEDDAQNGVDHVDGHRTVALAISPYVRRGAVDSTFYAQQSILKTIELILGLPSLSLFDLIANDMRASFTATPDFTPYRAETPKQPLDEVNPPLKALRGPARQAALDSLRMRFDAPDAAPSARLNRILWHNVRGWRTPYPGVRQAVFAPLAGDLDDDERESSGAR